MQKKKRIEYGEYIVSDPEICHGHLTFKGSRILVADVITFVAQGKNWHWISQAYDNRITEEAIEEAITEAIKLTDASLLNNQHTPHISQECNAFFRHSDLTASQETANN